MTFKSMRGRSIWDTERDGHKGKGRKIHRGVERLRFRGTEGLGKPMSAG